MGQSDALLRPLTMFGCSSVVSPDLPATFGQLNVSDDWIVPLFQEFARLIHAHGAALMCQISHTAGESSLMVKAVAGGTGIAGAPSSLCAGG